MNNKQQLRLKSSVLGTNTLLNAYQGILAVTLIPVAGQFDWIIPTALILAVLPFDPQSVIDPNDEPMTTDSSHQKNGQHRQCYLWQQQHIKTYSLIPKSVKAEQLVVLEGECDDTRIGLLIQGEISHRDINFSDIKDIESEQADKISNAGKYALQLVSVHQQIYVVPNLSALSQQIW